MNYKRFRQENDSAERQNQANLEFFQNLNSDFKSGNYLTELNAEGVETQIISLTATPKVIPHKLTRQYVGFLVIELNASAIIYSTRSSDDDNFITLRSSAAVAAKIWVF